MPIRSHVDMCTFIVFLHVTQDNIDIALEEAVKAVELRHGAKVDDVLEKLQPRSKQIRFHENYHYWQGLRLPFLYRYAFISFFQMLKAFVNFSKYDNDYTKWSCDLPEMNRLEQKFRIGFAPGGQIFLGGDEAGPIPNATVQTKISSLDLLECAASLAEFQASTGGGSRSDPLALHRWSKRNPAYLAPYKFAAGFLGSESLALRTLLPLINASFHTSIPERTFIELLARVWGNFAQETQFSKQFLAQPEPCRWPELFQIWLGEIDYDEEVDANIDIFTVDYFRLTIDFWASRTFHTEDKEGISFNHPFLGPLARRWQLEEADNPALSMVIDMPGWIDSNLANYCGREFSPPISVANFHLKDGGDKVVWFGTADLSGFTSFENVSSTGFIADFLTMYGAVRRASGAHFDNEQRVCYHNQCPHYLANFCNAYPIVPSSYKECGFPDRIKRLIQQWRGTDGDTLD